MNDDALTPEEQADYDDYVNHPTIKNTDIVHYREPHTTHLNTDWLFTDLNRELGTSASVTWLRLMTGPENTPDGVVINDEIRDWLSYEDITFEQTLEQLEAIGAIEVDGDRVTFPNLVWGTPPADDEQE